MNDLINRQEAISAALVAIPHDDYWVEQVKMAINTIPAAQQWIPCSERMPEPYITVLVTYRSGVVSFAWYTGEYWTRGAMSKPKILTTVKAWMSLPEPYEGEEENG